jgi:hypothetical protein
MVELAQIAGAGAEIAEVASTCFVITLVVRAQAPHSACLTHSGLVLADMLLATQGLAIGFVLLRVEASVQGDAE